MLKQRLVPVGDKSYFVTISEEGGNWHAHAVPLPPADGRTYILPQWHCDAASENALYQKLDEYLSNIINQ